MARIPLSVLPASGGKVEHHLVTRAKLARFGNQDHNGRIEINDNLLPLPAQDGASCISGSHVLTVVGLDRLRRLLPPNFLLGVESPYADPGMPIGSAADQLKWLAERLMSLPPNKRRFELIQGKQIGNPILWFTTKETASSLDLEFAHRRGRQGFMLSRADWYATAIGLGHWKTDDWLAVLRIPTVAVERAGHYRPAFPDGATHPWFMVAANVAERPPCDAWGRTVNLRRLRKSGAALVAGAHERVARQLLSADFEDTATAGSRELIEFEVLGQVTRDWGSPALVDKLADRIARGASSPWE